MQLELDQANDQEVEDALSSATRLVEMLQRNRSKDFSEFDKIDL